MFSVAAIGVAAFSAYYLYINYASDECPIKQMLTVKRTPFHEFIHLDSSQEDKEKQARAWMEKYVRSVLLKKSVESKETA